MNDDFNLNAAGKLKYIIEETFPEISDDDKKEIIDIGEKVMEASWHFMKIFGEDEYFWQRKNQIEEKYAKDRIIKALNEGNARLAEYLKNPDIIFYLSSCRVVAMGYADGKTNALESMISSVRRLKE